MCTASLMGGGAGKDVQQGDKSVKPISAIDVPLGDGLADVARTSILTRRDRIRKAMEDAGE